jgi:hypothetical protein
MGNERALVTGGRASALAKPSDYHGNDTRPGSAGNDPFRFTHGCGQDPRYHDQFGRNHLRLAQGVPAPEYSLLKGHLQIDSSGRDSVASPMSTRLTRRLSSYF